MKTNPCHSGRNTLVESGNALLLEHIASDGRNPRPRRLARQRRSPLDTSLDGIDGRISERADGAGDETDDGRLP